MSASIMYMYRYAQTPHRTLQNSPCYADSGFFFAYLVGKDEIIGTTFGLSVDSILCAALVIDFRYGN